MLRISREQTARLAGAVLAFTTSCAFDPIAETPERVEAPHVFALSAYESSVGALIEIYGTGFPDPADGALRLVFQGTFEPRGGSSRAPVELEVEPRIVDRGTARWTTFGPYRNPFSATGTEIGTFVGTIAARVVSPDGRIVDDADPIAIRFEVLPSILVHELQPITASCSGPAKRALGGASYRIRVEAVGFDPSVFTYTLAAPAIGLSPLSIRHLARGRFDAMGDRGDFQVPPVPEGVQTYNVVISIDARRGDGGPGSFQSAFALAVHRPLEVFYDGNAEVAEVLEPVPVSGCIPGGEAGRMVEYTEATEETRARHYDVSWNESWVNTHTVSSGTSDTVGLSETNGVGFATSDGQNWNWSLGTEVGGTFGLSELVSVGVKATGTLGGGGSRAVESSSSRETEVNAETTTTETEEASTSSGGEVGEEFAWEVSSSQNIARNFGGTVVAGTFGVFYRQALRVLRRAAVVTYNQCGAATVVGEVGFSDWTWSPDLALGPTCPPLPETNLPRARCVIPPCGAQ